MVLEELHKSFTLNANKIPNWQTVSKLSLAKGYVENETNLDVRDAYFSAFALRYWHEIPTLFREAKFLVNKLHLTIDDIADWYFEALMDVFKYRAFVNPEVFKYVKDGKEDKFINGYVYRAIDSTRERYFQYYNYGKRKSNLVAESLDTIVDEKGDYALVDNNNYIDKYGKIDRLIRKLVSDNEIYEALVIYAIVYGNSFSKIYENGVAKAQYIPKKATNLIKELSEEEIDEFIKEYANNRDISYDLYKFRFYSPQWNNILYQNALEKLKKNKEVLEICY